MERRERIDSKTPPTRTPTEWINDLRFMDEAKTRTVHMCSPADADHTALLQHLSKISRLTDELSAVGSMNERCAVTARIGRELDAARRALRPHIQTL